MQQMQRLMGDVSGYTSLAFSNLSSPNAASNTAAIVPWHVSVGLFTFAIAATHLANKRLLALTRAAKTAASPCADAATTTGPADVAGVAPRREHAPLFDTVLQHLPDLSTNEPCLLISDMLVHALGVITLLAVPLGLQADFVALFSILLAIRAAVMSATVVPAISKHCQETPAFWFLPSLTGCHDLVFSSHTAFTVCCVAALWLAGCLTGAGGAAIGFAFVATVVGAIWCERMHYSSDVLLACSITGFLCMLYAAMRKSANATRTLQALQDHCAGTARRA
jgi:hypothetical protein